MTQENWNTSSLDYRHLKNYIKTDKALRYKFRFVELFILGLCIVIFPAFVGFNFYLYWFFITKLFIIFGFLIVAFLISFHYRRTLELWQDKLIKEKIILKLVKFSFKESLILYAICVSTNAVFYFSGFFEYLLSIDQYNNQVVTYIPSLFESILIIIIIVLSFFTIITFSFLVGTSFLNSHLKLKYKSKYGKMKPDPSWIFTLEFFGMTFWVMITDLSFSNYQKEIFEGTLEISDNFFNLGILILVLQILSLCLFNLFVIKNQNGVVRKFFEK